MYDVLPSPVNLCTWGLAEEPSCSLCKKPASLEHILSSCGAALADGRYKWRHDRVLAEIAACMESARKRKTSKQSGAQFIHFVRPGQTKVSIQEKSILGTACDWQMAADIGQVLHFPPEVTQTSLRPDVVLWSRATKSVVVIELTVPWEERIEDAHERKLAMYQGLLEECQQNGWKTWCFPMEVGCRGFVGQSL